MEKQEDVSEPVLSGFVSNGCVQRLFCEFYRDKIKNWQKEGRFFEQAIASVACPFYDSDERVPGFWLGREESPKEAPKLELSPDFFVGNSQFSASFSSSGGYHISSTWGSHSSSESVSSHAFNITRLVRTFHETPNLSIYDRKNMRSFERFLVPSWKSRGIGKNDWTATFL